MKRKILLSSCLGVAAILGTTLFFKSDLFSTEGKYAAKDLTSLEKQTAKDAIKWLEARYIDVNTGEKVTHERFLELLEAEKFRPKAGPIEFEELGPDNIGGRTRAILVDKTNNNRIYAGGVSGGLFITENKANVWTRIESFPGLPYISSMTQTGDGTVFVATGSINETWSGNGVYYTQDNGVSWELLPGTSSLSTITEIVCSTSGNTIFLATSGGVKKYTVGDASISNVTISNGTCSALQMSTDGMVLVAAMGSNKTYVSTDGGDTWVDQSGTSANKKVPANAGRIEYAISPIKNESNMYSIYAVRTGSNLTGMNVSHDNGQTWDQFVGASGTPSNLDIYRDQGTYNSIVSVAPNDPKNIFIGGIDIWQWKQTVDNPPAGGFNQMSQWFVAPSSSIYVHADNHEMKWDANDRLYLGNDGGIGITNDYGLTFFPANRGYNATQFYGIAMDRDGRVMGGTQDNGTLYNDFTLSTLKQFKEVGGGDGFEAEISFFNPSVMFRSIYYGQIARSGDRGSSFSSFVPTFPTGYSQIGVAGGNFPFHTEYVLAENYDENSEDSVKFIAFKNYPANSVIKVPSAATGDTIKYTTPVALYYDDTVYAKPSLTEIDYKVRHATTNAIFDLGELPYTTIYNASGPVFPPAVGDTLLVDGTFIVPVDSAYTYNHYYAQNAFTNEIYNLKENQEAYGIAWDTVNVADPYQSWFVMYVNANGGELWGTRDALRLSKSNVVWEKIAQNIGGNGFSSVDIEFSRDLNYCYVSAGTRVYRIDGLGSIYSQDANFSTKVAAAASSKVQISSSSVEGLAVNPNNPDDVILLQGFSGTITRSNNATSASPTFTALTSLGVGAYDAIIDRDDEDLIVVGTAFGVKVSTNGGGSWTDASTGFENVPVYEVRQNWRTYAEGCSRPGEIYLGTFGRGIWASASVLGIGKNNNDKTVENKAKLKIYPNPATDVTTLSFNLKQTSNVVIRVYNIAGQLVQTHEQKNVTTGQQSFNFNVNALPNGTYIVKFNAGQQSETTKFIKL